MIAPDTLQALRESVSLYDVISRFVDLKKSGADWAGLCPFHGDKSPSFTIAENKKFYHCFGCGAHGDAIDFLQRINGSSFQEAVNQLASEHGLQVGKVQGNQPLRATVRFQPAPKPKTAQGLDASILDKLTQWQADLPDSPAMAYLESRKIPLEIAQAVGAGYLPKGDYMGLNQEGKPTGWGPRVVFPHTLPGGQLVNLYGRSIDAEADKGQKHRHLPQGKGLLNAEALALDGPLWLVEGAFDAMALMAAGVQKVVAVFGLDGFDWRWIGKPELIIAIDTDEAGQVAARKLMEEAAYRGIKASRFDAYGDHKDAADAWAAGALDVGQQGLDAVQQEVKAIQGHITALGDAPDKHLTGLWSAYKTMASRFATFYLADALRAGWTLQEIFGLPATAHGFDGGLIWTLTGFRLDTLEIEPDAIVIKTTDGAKMTHRKGASSQRLPW
jgi:DNA primase